ncbi:MAG: hypothetical protein V2I26_17775 [Halieaceae bacterium]|nr:hypothetical protein [Halieaceae bacterium]
MATREEIQAEMEAKLAAGSKQIDEMKAEMAKAGDKVSAESAEALKDAERLLEKGKAKYAELASASDEQFDKVVASTKETWEELSSQIEGGWAAVTDKVKSFFS